MPDFEVGFFVFSGNILQKGIDKRIYNVYYIINVI